LPLDETEPLFLLALAIIDYNENKIEDALGKLKKIIFLNPLSPADIWLAIGICYSKLNNLPKAKFALEHVLKLQPNNSMALTSLGIVELQINFYLPNHRIKAAKLF
jgi:tetratricopeptide (TPR) repeat protein